MNSTHRVEVVPVELRPHPNADTLSIAKVHGYEVVVKTEHWASHRLAAYIPPDNVVPTWRREFAFLFDRAKQDGTYRVKAMKLRGVQSFGLLVPAPEGTEVGQDVTQLLEVTHYQPPDPADEMTFGKNGVTLGGESCPAPACPLPSRYELEALRRYGSEIFVEGEPVLVHEKCDGSFAQYVYWDGAFHCGSRNGWKREFPSYSHVTVENLVARGLSEDEAKAIVEKVQGKEKKRNVWWECLRKLPELEAFLQNNPGMVVCGEVFGTTNCIKYCFAEVNRFNAFDIFSNGWLDPVACQDIANGFNLPWVPLVAKMPYDFDAVAALAEGKTLCAGAREGTIREGVVVSALSEREHPRHGRSKLKAVSATFFERYR